MLKLRVITAALLLSILLATILAPTAWPLLIFLSVMAGCALWEWLRLTLAGRATSVALPAGVALGVLLIGAGSQLVAALPHPYFVRGLISFNQIVMPVVAALWIVGATAAVIRANTQSRRRPFLLSIFGLIAVIALWFSLAQLFVHYGAWFLVSMLALIWFADSAAYFVGKTLGRHKLAPRISPGKTWEGALGGVLGAVVWMLVSVQWDNSFSAILMQRWGAVLMLLISVFLASLSIVGDLFESLLKRRAGVKDSSQLLPGHGGVYDRIDALFPVAPVAWLLAGVQ